MGLKLTVDKLEDVPENARAMYKPEGGKFVLDVEGAVPRERLDEFRNNNIELQQKLEKLKDVDPVKYRELMELDRKVQEKQLIDKGDVDGLVNLRTNEMRKDFETKEVTYKTQLDSANAQLSMLLIDNAVKSEAIKLGVHETAVEDVVLRARSTFVVDKGQPVPKDAAGQVIYGKDGVSPKSVGDWLVDVKKTAPHLFKGAQGSGAGGGRQGPGGNVTNLSPAAKIAMGLNQAGLQQVPSDLAKI
jgi:hypothetical protein